MRKIKLLVLLSIFAFNVQAETIKIGWIGPLTGNAAVLGIDSANTAKMVFDRANQTSTNRKYKLIFEDDQYNTAKAIKAYNKLVYQGKVQVLYMLTYGALFALAPKAKQDGVLMIDPLDCDEEIAKLPDNIVCVASTTEELGRVIAEKAISNKDYPPAIIYYNEDPFMLTLSKNSIKEFVRNNLEVAYTAEAGNDLTDFRSILLKAKSKQVKSIFFYGYDQMGLAMKQARDLGINVQFYSVNTITSPGFIKLAAGTEEGTLVGTWLAPRNKTWDVFLEEYKRLYKKEVDFEVSAIPSYDVAEVIVQALNQSKTSESNIAKIVQKHFYSLKNYQGLSGNITMDSDGVVRSLKNIMLEYKDGKLQEISQ